MPRIPAAAAAAEFAAHAAAADFWVAERAARRLAVLTLSADGAAWGGPLAQRMGADFYVHEQAFFSAAGSPVPYTFKKIAAQTATIFRRYAGLIYIMPTGVVVRSIAPLIESKLRDPAVVVLDVCARHAISLLSGHEGGANALAIRVANLTGAEPVITTTTDARKDIIAGIGCRKGVSADTIRQALTDALGMVDCSIGRVRYLATAGVKAQEAGLLQAAATLGVPLRIIPDEAIRQCVYKIGDSEFVRQKVGLPGVCEPAALLASRSGTFILNKTPFRGVTIALVRENRASSLS